MLAGVSLVAVLGLVVSMYPLLSQQGSSIWPWPKTMSMLLAGVSLSMGALVLYLTRQQSRAAGMQFRLFQLEEEAKHAARKHYARLLAVSNVSEIMGAINEMKDIFDVQDEISRTIVEEHGGRIWVEDGESGGASFHLEKLRLFAPIHPGQWPRTPQCILAPLRGIYVDQIEH